MWVYQTSPKIYSMKKYYILFLLALSLTSFTLQAQNYEAAIEAYINANQKKFTGTTSPEYVLSTFAEKKKDYATVYAKQTLNGIEIYNAISSFAIKDGKVIYAADRFVKNLKTRSAEQPNIDPQTAVEKAAKRFDLGATGTIQIVAAEGKDYLLSKGNISSKNIPARLLYVNTEDGLKLSWHVTIYEKSDLHWWSVNVDAKSGEILTINDLVLSCNFDKNPFSRSNHSGHNHDHFDLNLQNANASSALAGEQYRVFALPLESPNHGSRSLVVEPQDDLASPFGWHDIDGVPGAEWTDTSGNNVYSILYDSETEDLYFAEGGTNLNFDFDLNLDSRPIDYLDASLTNLFYMNNKVHDILYHYGFDEQSGNFQTNNYGRGRVDDEDNPIGDDDFVYALGQDDSGLNNATFATDVDGVSGVMRMFLWSATGPAGKLLTINSPNSLAGQYEATEATFGPSLTDQPISGDLALMKDDNSGSSTDSYDACDPLTNGNDLNGKIAVVQRGSCDFTSKVSKAQANGALAVIVVNNVEGEPIVMGGVDEGINIPSIMISLSDGTPVINALLGNEVINASLAFNGPYQKDGSLDNGIIAHEYGHGVSNRFTGGPDQADCLIACTERDTDGDCVGSTYTEQMGEGWSDYIGLILTMTANDSAEDPRGYGTYVIGEGTDGNGIRPEPYTTDIAINPLTYKDTNNDIKISAPHGVGSIWAEMLWEMTWSLIDVYGFDPDFYEGNGGNNIALQLVMQGMKLQPCQPGFVDGRDAILAADDLLYGGKHKCFIWKAFAKRGLGLSADQGDPLKRRDQKEAFDIPEEFQGECVLGVKNVQTQDAFKVYPNPNNGLFRVSLNRSFGDGEVTLYDLNGRRVYQETKTLEGNIELNVGSLSKGVYILEIKNDQVSQTEKLLIQ